MTMICQCLTHLDRTNLVKIVACKGNHVILILFKNKQLEVSKSGLYEGD